MISKLHQLLDYWPDMIGPRLLVCIDLLFKLTLQFFTEYPDFGFVNPTLFLVQESILRGYEVLVEMYFQYCLTYVYPKKEAI